MDTVKNISKIWHNLDIIIEKICIWISNVLDILGNFKYMLIGILMYEKSSNVIASDGCRFFSIMMILVGLVDGFHKISTCSIVRKISKTTTNNYVMRFIDWLDEVHCMFIEIRLNMVLEYVCNALCAFGLGMLLYSMVFDFNKDRGSYGKFDVNRCINCLFFSFGGWWSMFNIGSTIYNFVIHFYGLYKKFSDNTIKYSNTSGVTLLTTTASNENEEYGSNVYEGNGQARDTLFRLALLGLVISTLTFIGNLILNGSKSFSGWQLSTFIIGKIILILQYVMPSLRFSGGSNTVFLPVVFISLLTLYSSFGFIARTVLELGIKEASAKPSNDNETASKSNTGGVVQNSLTQVLSQLLSNT